MSLISRKRTVWALAILAASVTLKGAVMGAYNFAKAWKSVEEAQENGLPRTVTNKVEEIAREAIAAKVALQLAVHFGNPHFFRVKINTVLRVSPEWVSSRGR